MTPEIVQLLEDLREHLLATEDLLLTLPDQYRAGHIEARGRELAGRIAASLPDGSATDE